MLKKGIVSNDILIKSYNRLQNVWLVGKEVGLSGQTVWERLSKINKINSRRFLGIDELKDKYILYRDRGDLDLLAKELNRSKTFICAKARELGLITTKYKKTLKHKQQVDDNFKKYYESHGHAKSMLGKKHSKESREKMSKSRKIEWQMYSEEEKIRRTRLKSDAKILKYGTLCPPNNRKTTWKQGWREINSIKYFFRSSWEYNYACFLQFQKNNNNIIDWKYEPRMFYFEKELYKVSYYLPDFEVTLTDKSIEYHEVKGWMDNRSILKLNLMKKWYPEIKIVIIDIAWFRENNNYSNIIKEWENN